MTKILIVEDDKFLASAYKLKFQKTDLEVKIASDGEEALELVKTYKPDAILLDLIIPKLDGFSVLEKLQSDATFKKIPVIITSNLGQDADIKKGMALGAKDYFIKSNISLEEIVNRVIKLIDGTK